MPNSPPENHPYPAWTRAESARKFRLFMTGAGLIAHRLAERSPDESETRALRVTATVLLGIPFILVVALLIFLFYLDIRLQQ